MPIITIIIVICVTQYFTDKGDHTVLDKINTMYSSNLSKY